jgi:hypothetical protein
MEEEGKGHKSGKGKEYFLLIVAKLETELKIERTDQVHVFYKFYGCFMAANCPTFRSNLLPPQRMHFRPL